MATYFDKSFFPYNPNSDIEMYGKAFHMDQPDLPKDLEDLYYTRSWQDTDTYGPFQHTRMFLGMLNKFFDRSQDEARYFQSLSSTEQHTERSRLSQRDGDYYWSMRQTVSNKLGMLDELLNPSVYRGDLDKDGKIDGVILKNAFVKDDINNPINGTKSEELWNELRTEGVINSDGSVNNFNTDSDLGLSPENIEQYKDHILDILKESSIRESDSNYVVSQLICSLVGRPGVSGRYLNQIQRDSMGTLMTKFLDGRIPDSIVQDMLAHIGSVDYAGADLFQLTESQSMAYAQNMANGKHPLSDAMLYGLAVLLATSQHLFLQGRRNLFGWANQGFNQWGSDSAVAESKTRQTILSTFNPQDQMVFDQQLAGNIDTDPLGAMIHDLSIKLGDPETVYRQQSVIRDSKNDQVTTWVFQSKPADDGEAPTWVGVSPVAYGFEWQHGEYHDSTWTPNAVPVTGLSQLDRNSIERRLMAWDPLRTVIQKIMDGAVRYLQAQTGDDGTVAKDAFVKQADISKNESEKIWDILKEKSVFDESGKIKTGITINQENVNTWLAGKSNATKSHVLGILQQYDGTLSAAGLYGQSQSAIQTLTDAVEIEHKDESYKKWLQAFPVATLYRALALAEGSSDTDFSTYQSLYTVESAGWTDPDDPGISISGSRRVFVDQGYFYRMNEAMTQQLTADKRLFLNKGVAQSRANATYNQRRRDKQAMKAAQWVRDYKAWRDEQDALLS